MTDLTHVREAPREDAETEPATHDVRRPSIASLLGGLALGLLAIGWVALLFADRGQCERDGIVLTCTNGVLETEINLPVSAALVVFGTLAVLRGVIGIGLRARDVLTDGPASPVDAALLAAPAGPSAPLPPPVAEPPASAPSAGAAPPEPTAPEAPSTGPPPWSAPSWSPEPPIEPPPPPTGRAPLYRRPVIWIVAALALIVGGAIVVIVAGRGTSTAEALPGVYTGTGDEGFRISITVEDGGDAIGELTVEVQCGSLGRSSTITFVPPMPIDGGRFTLREPPTGGFGVNGRFVGDGTRARGDWSTGRCSGDWDADLTTPAPAAEPPADPDVGDAEAEAPAVDPEADDAQGRPEPAPPAAEAPEASDSLTFVPAAGNWSRPGLGTYRATTDQNAFGWAEDAFAWSDEVVDGDFVLEVDVTSDFRNFGEGMVVVYGDGEGFSRGSLIFNITGYWQAIRAHTIYEDDGAVWLVQNDNELGVSRNLAQSTFTMTVEVIGDTATLYLDGEEVASTSLPADIARRGRIALAKYVESDDVTYSNIRFESLPASAATGGEASPTTGDETSPATEAVIAATDGPIVAGDHEFVVAAAGFDTTVSGLEPTGGLGGDRVLFVEFELLSGDRTAFEELEIVVTDDAGRESTPLALMTGGGLEVLSDLVMTGGDSTYRADPAHVTWAYAVADTGTDLVLRFPTGELVALDGLLDSSSIGDGAVDLGQLFVDSFYRGMPPAMRAVFPDDEVRCAAELAVERLTVADIEEFDTATPAPGAVTKVGEVLDECFSADTVRDLITASLVEGGFDTAEAECLADETGPLRMSDFLEFGGDTGGSEEFEQRIADAMGACGVI